MITTLLSTGDEVLLGDIVDTNAAWLARQLKDLGIPVHKKVAIGDHLEHLSETILTIAGQAELCIVTGGLGPTKDDMTAEACAKAAEVELALNPEAMDSMTAFFKKRGFVLTKENRRQAQLPRTAAVLVNEFGTAPGFRMNIDGCLFLFLPGVPSEMKPMFKSRVLPLLESKFGLKSNFMIERLTLFGLGESAAGAALSESETRFPPIKFGFRVHFPYIEVKLVCTHDHEASRPVMEDAKAWAIDQLKDYVVSKSGLSLVKEVAKLLLARQKTVAIAESCTGGLIANMMTDVSGSSDYFLFSGVTYSNEAKMAVLGVKKETILSHGAVHDQTAREMAVGARRVSGADVAISTTGIAGPTGGTKEKPVGMVCIGLANDTIAEGRTFNFPFEDRMMNKKIFAAAALETLRRHLLN